jgi:hypothetical protein
MAALRSRAFFCFAATVVLGAVAAEARPVGPRLACAAWGDDFPVCRGAIVACTLCHVAPPELNPYGLDVAGALFDGDLDYDTELGTALDAVNDRDSDGDGLTNLEELVLGTAPGDANSYFVAPAAPSGPTNPRFAVGTWDPAFAWRRMSVAYCARSPTFEEQQAFAAAADPRARLHADLDACLASDHWRNEGLPRLADKRIRPLGAIGIDGVIPLADFAWDYRLWVHALTDDRDARDLLRADYHVDAAGNEVTAVIPGNGDDQVGGQPTPRAQRAGMITTQWFLMVHTMFSELPRTTAAQAYRAYLGQDIARSEGLLPTDGEPVDIDDKGVDDQETCIHCHATLDPLAYAFAHYNGIGGGGGNGAFRANRPSWSPSAVQAVVLDVPLTNTASAGVTGWADVAADSQLFRMNLARMFLTHALGRPVAPDEEDELAALADSMVDDGYVARALLHRLVDTDAFGAP